MRFGEKGIGQISVRGLTVGDHKDGKIGTAGGDENGMAHSRDDRVVFDVEKAGLAFRRSFHFFVGIGRAKYSASEGGRKASDITMISTKIREKWCSSIASLRIRESRAAAGCKTSPSDVHSSHLKNRRSHTARRRP